MVTADEAVDALFAHTGVIRAATLDQLLDVGALLGRHPAPLGRRVALVGNAAGLLLLAADAAGPVGLELVQLSTALRARLRSFVPAAVALENPVDLSAEVSIELMIAVAREIASSGEVDAVALLRVDVGPAAAGAPTTLDWPPGPVPAVAVRIGGPTSTTGTMPTYPTPERAMDALALATGRGRWLTATSEDEPARRGPARPAACPPRRPGRCRRGGHDRDG